MIDYHKNKTIAFINSIVGVSKDKAEVDAPETCKSQGKDTEVGTIINENPKIYLGTTITANPNLVNLLFIPISFQMSPYHKHKGIPSQHFSHRIHLILNISLYNFYQHEVIRVSLINNVFFTNIYLL